MVTMAIRKRLYDTILSEHLASQRQMGFVTGPRQVGKTTTCRRASGVYLDWDNSDHREAILAGPPVVAERIGREVRVRPLGGGRSRLEY